MSINLLLLILIFMSGCSIGVKEQVRIVYVRVFKEPEESKKFIRIATNKKIAITLMSDSKEPIATTLDAGGMIIMDEQQLAQTIREAKK